MLTREELDRLRVVLVRSRNPLNIGAAARALSNFGCLRLRVVHPYAVAFREARSAVDAEPVLTAAEEFEQVAPAIADCALVVGTTAGSRRTPEAPPCRLEAGAEQIRAHLRSGSRVALLFGSEKVGLSNQDLSHCQLLVRIPTRTEHPSMNLGQAVAVVLYELIREAPTGAAASAENIAGQVVSGQVVPVQSLATSGERERLIALLLEGLSVNGFDHGVSHARMEKKLRRLVRHLALTPSDMSEWLGLLRQLLGKLRAAQPLHRKP
ncbi:MAG TPA: RNA methyltransferase [Acidobacteriaceae bacterium]|nr:RNA methyltransferase [Acidobacteriaceae bacterium]